MKRCREEDYIGPQSRDEASGQPPVPGEARREGTQALTMNDTLTYLKTMKGIFQDESDKYLDFLQVIKDFKAQRIGTTDVMARLKELFKEHQNLILGVNAFLPVGFKIILLPEAKEPSPKKSVELHKTIKFINKLKTWFQDDDNVNRSFLNILHMYLKENKSINEVYKEASNLFSHHQDLLEEFKIFLPHDSPATTTPTQHEQPFQECTPSYRLLPVNSSTSSTSDKSEVGAQVLNDGCPSTLVTLQTPTSSTSNKSEVGAQVLNDGCPSTLVTLQTPTSPASDDEYAEVLKELNNSCRLVIPRSENYSSNHKCISKPERMLFKSEDERFELDVLYGSLETTIECVEDLLKNINNNSITIDDEFKIEHHLTAPRLRCIERLYGDYGLDVIDLLRKNVSPTLSVILHRLKQKWMECSRFRSDCNKVWHEKYAKKYPKSHDHHGK